MCAKVNGYISVENGLGIGRTVLKSEMHDPEAYVDKNLNAKYTEPLPDIPKFLDSDRQNFIIRKKDIKKVYNNPAPKWGMGYYPYGGRIIIETTKKMYNSSRTTELILIGDQNPEEILAKINRH